MKTEDESSSFRLILVVGTRPNFMKVAPVVTAIHQWNEQVNGDRRAGPIEYILVHTGQHYDQRMSRVFFDDLDLPEPDHYLGIGSGTHAEQTANLMLALEPILLAERPDVVVVVGDVNSTLAATLVAAKLGIPVAHVEAGLRSRDRSMPEELNRLVTDQLADILLTTSRDADENLLGEGIPTERVFFVGNTMIDSLTKHLASAKKSLIHERLGITAEDYAVVTLHRPSNVDDTDGLARLVDLLAGACDRLPVVFPVHARTRDRLSSSGLSACLEDSKVILTEPLGYLDFLALLAGARVVLTDSGGIQEETTVLGVSCLTLRKNTERPVTIWEGTNRLVDPEDSEGVLAALDEELARANGLRKVPEFWDGRAGQRIVQVLVSWLMERGSEQVAPGLPYEPRSAHC